MLDKKLLASLILSLLMILSLAACGKYAPTPPGPVGFPGFAEYPPPYTGVIQNHSSRDVVFQSENSGATLIVPAKKCLEFVAWSDSFNLIGYVDGKMVYCQKIQVSPKSYQYKCKSYDFMAEIQKIRKKKRWRKDGVEAFG